MSAAKLGAKRCADTAKLSVDPELAAKFKCVKAAIQTAPSLQKQADAMKMLDVVIPLSLGGCREGRHDFQNRVVDCIGELLQNMETGLKNDAEEASVQVQDAKAARDARNGSVSTAIQALSEKLNDVADAKQKLADVTIAFRDERDALKLAETRRDEHDGHAAKTVAKLDETKIAVREWLTPLLTDTSFGEADCKAARTNLMHFLGSKVGLDESLMTALPAALERTPEERGPFDILAVQELQTTLASRVAAIEEEVQGLVPAKSELEAACDSAKARRDAAAERLRAAADFFTESQKRQQESEAALAQARKIVRDAANALRKVEGSLERANAKLVKLQDGALNAFTELRDQRVTSEAVDGHVKEGGAEGESADQCVAVAAEAQDAATAHEEGAAEPQIIAESGDAA